MARSSSACRLVLAIALLGLSSCGYLADRGLDFLDQYRVGVGVGSGAGVRFRNGGLLDTGLMFGVKPRATALGWHYGTPQFLQLDDARVDANQAEIVRNTHLLGMDYAAGSYDVAWTSFAILPALFTWVDATPEEYAWHVPETENTFEDEHWLWSVEGFKNNRYAQVHAFDVEFGAALLVYGEVGFSVGEFVDFLLGWLLIDIAADDGRLGG